MKSVLNWYFQFFIKGPLYLSFLDTFWALFWFNQYQWFPDYWIIFWLQSADFSFNLITFWIESWVKQYWIAHWMKIQLLNQIGYRPPLSPKHEKCLFFEDAKPDTFWLNARDSQVKDEVKSRVVVGWLIFHKIIREEILCSCTTLWNISQTKYYKKSGVAVQYSKIFQKKISKKTCVDEQYSNMF